MFGTFVVGLRELVAHEHSLIPATECCSLHSFPPQVGVTVDACIHPNKRVPWLPARFEGAKMSSVGMEPQFLFKTADVEVGVRLQVTHVHATPYALLLALGVMLTSHSASAIK